MLDQSFCNEEAMSQPELTETQPANISLAKHPSSIYTRERAKTLGII